MLQFQAALMLPRGIEQISYGGKHHRRRLAAAD
jgi:hypothetical protein